MLFFLGAFLLLRALKTESLVPGGGRVDAPGAPVCFAGRRSINTWLIIFGNLCGFAQFVLRKVAQCVSYCCICGIDG
jgi:hypothetical protein